MDKLQIIESIIKYLPMPAFVIKDGETVLKNERAKKIELPDIGEKLSFVQNEGGSVMWDDVINFEKCTATAWSADEYCILTLNSISDSVFAAAKKISAGIRNPLGSVHACAKLIMNRLDEDDPTADKYCAAMSQSLYRMMRLMGNLDVLSGAEEYEGKLKFKNTDIGQLLKDFAENARPFVNSLGMELECLLPASPVICSADGYLLEIAAGNLVGNSLKYSKPGTKITLKLNVIGSNIVISVKDTGSGMSTEKLQRIASESGWEDIGDMIPSSAGMGLMIARFAAMAHGGNMMIESREGAGTNVMITFPVKKSEELNLCTHKCGVKPDALSPLTMFADVLSQECYMFTEM